MSGRFLSQTGFFVSKGIFLLMPVLSETFVIFVIEVVFGLSYVVRTVMNTSPH